MSSKKKPEYTKDNRPSQDILTNPKIVKNEEDHHIGSGYFIPEGYDAQQLRDLYLEWNLKLQKSGHSDVEVYSNFHPGRSSPRLRRNHPLQVYNSQRQLISNLIDTYLNYFTRDSVKEKRQKKYYYTDYFLLQCYSNGIHLGILVEFFATVHRRAAERFVAKHELHNINIKALTRAKGRTKFWIYYRTRAALAYCYAWHLSHPLGELTETLVNTYKMHGLDIKEAPGIINRARRRAKLAPIKLKWELKNY